MKRIVTLVLVLAAALHLQAATTWKVTTWNLEWFPGGPPDQANPSAEPKRIAAAAEVLRGLNSDIVLLQEVRDEAAATALAKAMGPDYQVVVASRFVDRDGIAIGQQQQVILAKFAAKAAYWREWTTFQQVDPPRGFAFALFVTPGGTNVAVYSLHLKSNGMPRDADRQKQATLNRLQRELAAQQVMRHIAEIAKIPELKPKAAIVGGDFNTDPKDPRFKGELTHSYFTDSGFTNPLSELPLFKRITLPGSNRYPDVTFDYLLFHSVKPVGGPQILLNDVSDHRPVTYSIEVP